MRNAVYAGTWVSDAKRYFSRSQGPAYVVGNKYVRESPIRQEYLEAAIQWLKDKGQAVEGYMGTHQHDPPATALWNHFQSVINRVKAVFPEYCNPMKGVEWGGLYSCLRDESLNSAKLEAEVARPMIDNDVTKQAGIYPYLLTGEERHLNIRAFTEAMKQKAFEIQKGICKV